MDENRTEPPPSIYTIREIYESQDSGDRFSSELERALDAKYKFILIEPRRLADETTRWITAGNIIHKTSVVTGLSSICFSLVSPTRQYISFPLCVASIVLTGVYTISWFYDHCSKYQVEEDVTKLNQHITKTATKVLIYKDNKKSSYIHRTVTCLAVGFCGFQYWRNLK